MTFHTTARRHFALLLAAPLLVLAACSDSPTDPDDHDAEPVTAEVYERGTENILAYVHGDHWDGSVTLGVGEEIAIDVRFLDADGDVIPLGGEYTVEAEIAQGQPTDVIHFDAHGDHIDIEGVSVGETGLILHFWHGGHADWSTPPLNITVEAGEPVTAEIYERGTENRLAYVHDDHWDGGIDLQLGEEIEVDVRFLDEFDNVIPLGGEYTVEAEVAAGQPTDVIHFDAHGDHIDIEAAAVGETRLILHFWHDGHADWSTPGLRVTVEAVE